MANTYLTRTFGSSPSTTLFTWSAWVKRGKLGTQQAMISGCSSHGASTGQLIYFTNDDKLAYYAQESGTAKCNLTTNAQFRDTNAWYHIVLKVDSSQSNVANRVVFYVNNVESSYTTTTEHAQNWEAYFMIATPTDVGRNGMNTSDYFDGVMSHMHMTHGYNYTPSAFGEYDANGVWKIKTSPSVTYGTNGFFILKNGNSVTDQSGNSNNFTVGGGTLTKTEDSPSNVFATLNPLIPSNGTTSNGNLSYTTSNSSSNWGYRVSTIGVSSGKWYSECKLVSGTEAIIGIRSYLTSITNNQIGYYSDDVGLYKDGRKTVNNVLTSYAGSYTAGDIIGIAIDLDNNKLYFSKGGLWSNGSGGWGSSTFDANVGSITITSASSSTSGFYFPGCTNWDSSSNASFSFNFGNGYFGTTAVASAGTNASGNGIFEYDCPDGYTALSTKGLNL
jgi:hypothetical protein